MLHKRATAILLGLVLVSLGSSTGCVRVAYGPNLGLLGWPIPVSPYFQDELEDKAWVQERYKKVPILGPITEGGPVVALDPPSPDEVMRALEEARPVEGGIPLLHEIQRNNVRMIIEPIADYVDPPRVYPLLGPAQQHHAHYKCTIFFSEATRVGWPIPYTAVNQEAQEVVYIDHNHLHIVGNVDGGPGSEY